MDGRRAAGLLGKSAMFAGLGEAELEVLGERAMERSFRRREVVFHEGDPGEALFVVVSGTLKVFVTGASGVQMVLSTLGPGEMFGELAVLDGGARSATVEAVEAAQLLVLTRLVFFEVMAARPALAEAVVRSLVGLVRRVIEQASDFVFLDLHGRVAKLLVGMAERSGGSRLDLAVTQSDLAAMVGGSRQSVNVILGELQRQGLIELDGRSVAVSDLAALRRRAGVIG